VFRYPHGQKKRRAFALARSAALVLIEDLAVVNFDNFAFGIGDQHVATAHIGVVSTGVRRGQITLLPLFNGVFWRQINAGTVSPTRNCVKSGETVQFIFLYAAAEAAQTLVQANSTPRSIIFVLRIISSLLSWITLDTKSQPRIIPEAWPGRQALVALKM
jgi:hypothetical protein